MQKEIVITEGNKPLWKIFIASVLFTASILSLAIFLFDFYIIGLNDKKLKGILGLFELSVLLFMYAIRLSIVKTVFLNSQRSLFRSEYRVGPFSYSQNKKIKELKYISVFKNDKEVFEINLWYDSNKHLKMFVADTKEAALNLGRLMSDKIEIDLFDATEKGNFKWIEK